MAPPHTRVCGWRQRTRQATFLACVIELGGTGSSLKPPRCDDTTGNHPNHFLLGLGLTLAPSISTPSKQVRGWHDIRTAAGQQGSSCWPGEATDALCARILSSVPRAKDRPSEPGKGNACILACGCKSMTIQWAKMFQSKQEHLGMWGACAAVHSLTRHLK